MKKIFITIITILTTTIAVSQEKGTNEITASIGGITSNDLDHFFEDELLSGFFGSVEYSESKSVSFNLAYKKAIDENLFLFGELSYQNIKKELTLRKINIGNVNLNHSTLAVGIDYRYINTEWFTMYSGVALGFTHKSINHSLEQNKFDELESSSTVGLFSNSLEQEYDQLKNSTENYFNFQLNGIGIRVGKSLAGTLEVGYGYKGIVNLGVSYQF